MAENQYMNKCENCECILHENVSIECISKDEEEQTWCMTCWNDLGAEMRAEGWIGQGDEEEETRCENCDCELPESVFIECVTRGDEANPWCMECWHDLGAEMRAEGWKGQFDEEEETEEEETESD